MTSTAKIATSPIEPVAVMTATWRISEPVVNTGACMRAAGALVTGVSLGGAPRALKACASPAPVQKPRGPRTGFDQRLPREIGAAALRPHGCIPHLHADHSSARDAS